ncbi:MAG: hypothetical protein HC852_05455 [Acaryochloridaceae cyanobacterium RU_4_10]|nr:hypothetical protein [Acaryochloridaceae cyanobacterium RU_4_10]
MRNFPFFLGSALASVASLGTPLLAQPALSPLQQQQIRNLPSNPFTGPFDPRFNSPFENRYPEPLKPKEEPILDFSAVEQTSKCTSPGGYEGHWISFVDYSHG